MPLNIEGYEIRNRDVRLYEQTSIVRSGLGLYLDASIFNTVTYGSTWFDISGNDENGVLENSPTYSSTNGGMISFDGVDDRAYINTTTFASTTPSYFTFQITSKGAPSRLICRSGAGWWYSTNTFTLGRIKDYTLSSYTFNSTDNYVMVYVIANDNFKRYINGSLIDSITISTSRSTCNNNLLYISAMLNSDGTIRYHSESYLYSLIMYNRALSAAEIAHNYNVTKGRFGL